MLHIDLFLLHVMLVLYSATSPTKILLVSDLYQFIFIASKGIGLM